MTYTRGLNKSIKILSFLSKQNFLFIKSIELESFHLNKTKDSC